ncbi:MAG TPA: hypothetical protein VJ949_00935 [Cryomorphaceae bacterium]|nr:hypothetical protein [Cryomorphaceae bacterium]
MKNILTFISTKAAMKTVLTIFSLCVIPAYLAGQTVADTSFLIEKTEDKFHEFYSQYELKISHDSTFYYFETSADIHRLEVINLSNEIIWDSKGVKPQIPIPVALFKQGQYHIRIHGSEGITEVTWFP